MPGYKRIVSYIYTYEKGERKENVGFVKLEARGEACRIAIHMRGSYAHGQIPYKAYLYAPGEDGILGMFLGELEAASGILEWKGSLGADALKQMPYELQDVRGIWIEGSGGKRYASEWGDAPVKVDSFRVYEEARESSELQPGQKEASLGQDGQQYSQIEMQDKQTEQSWEEIKQQYEQKELPQDKIEHINTLQDQAEKEKVPLQAEAELWQEPEAQPQEKTALQQKPEAQLQEQAAQSQEQMNLQSAQIEKELPVQEEEVLRGTEACQSSDKDPRQEKWEYLAGRFPVQRLFQNGKAPMFCIRIGPRDLQRLPRGNWVLGNNSFLLHGYYQYRHLLLCRQEEDGKTEYYLAVPGIYSEREQMMADLFGFEEFRRSRNAGNRGGNFGYWFRKIEEAIEEA